MRAPELARVVAALGAVAADDRAVQVDEAEAVVELRDVHDLVLVHVDLGRTLEAGPDFDELAVGRVDLDAVVLAVADVDLVLVGPDAVRRVEEARLVLGALEVLRVARLAPGLHQRAVGAELVGARVAVAVRDEDVAVVGDAHVGGLVERPGALADAVDDRDAAARDVRVVDGLPDFLRVAGVGRLVVLAEAHLVTEVLVPLRHEVRHRVDEVDVVVGRDADAVRAAEDLAAPVVDQLALLVEDHVRVLGAGEDVDVVLRVAGDAGAEAPLPAFGQLAPALDELVLARSDIDFHLAFLPRIGLATSRNIAPGPCGLGVVLADHSDRCAAAHGLARAGNRPVSRKTLVLTPGERGQEPNRPSNARDSAHDPAGFDGARAADRQRERRELDARARVDAHWRDRRARLARCLSLQDCSRCCLVEVLLLADRGRARELAADPRRASRHRRYAAGFFADDRSHARQLDCRFPRPRSRLDRRWCSG